MIVSKWMIALSALLTVSGPNPVAAKVAESNELAVRFGCRRFVRSSWFFVRWCVGTW
jgi:hypothetical protein